MKECVKKEIEKIIEKYDLNCSIEEFQDKVDWNRISIYQKLSLDFIREFQDEVNWYFISRHQELSKGCMKEFKSKLDWYEIIKNIKIMKNLLMN